MKVLHVMPATDRQFGGPVQALMGYVRAARFAEIDCSILGPESVPAEALWFRGAVAPSEVHFSKSYGSGSFAFSPAMRHWLQSHVTEFDLVHVHGLLNSISSGAAGICLRRSVPLVIRPFGTLSRFTLTHRRRLLKETYLRLVDGPHIRRAQAVHFTTAEEMREAAELGFHLSTSGFVVPPPLAIAPQRSAASHQRPAHPPTALYLSRLHPKKNLEGLLRGWVGVAARLPDARLLIAGNGSAPYVAQLHALAQSLAIESSVQFVGFANEEAKAALYDESDVFVLPSFHENFGVAVLEALAAGVPVIVSEPVQLATFVRSHQLGEIVGVDSPSITNALVHLLSNDAYRVDVRKRAPAVVADEFSLPAVGRQLRNMYEHALAAPSQRTA